jgi:hypothetical protein
MRVISGITVANEVDIDPALRQHPSIQNGGVVLHEPTG